MEGACSSLAKSPPSPVNTTIATSSITMTKLLLCVVLASSLLLASLAGASSSSLAPSLGRHQAQVLLGRKGRELGQSGHHYQHQSKHVQQDEEVAMEVKTPAETKNDWPVDRGDDAKEGLIYSADYSSVAVHAGSPPTPKPKPKHRHPKP